MRTLILVVRRHANILLPLLFLALLWEVQEVTPTHWQYLNSAVAGARTELRVQSSEIVRGAIYGLQSLAQSIHVMNEVDGFHSEKSRLAIFVPA